MEQFLSWNPSLGSIQPCMLQPGYSYCALNGTFSEEPEPPSICLPVKNEQIPPGSILNCSCFTTIEGEERDVRPCAAIAEDTFITIEQLMKWNPWVGSDCDKSVYAGLDDGQDLAVCIGVKSNSTSTN